MEYALAITVLFAPAYAVRFGLGGLPANGLMVWLGLLWLVFAARLVAQKKVSEFLFSIFAINRTLLILTGLFMLAGTISLFVGGADREKLGQWIVLFFQPIGTFFIARYILKNYPRAKQHLVNAMYVFVAVSGLYAIIQYFTLLGVPQEFWGNANEPKRAVGFFLHPNFYALFITPLLAFLLPVVSGQWLVDRKNLGSNHSSTLVTDHSSLVTVIAWVLGCVGLFLSLSRAGWLGLAAVVGVFLIVRGNKQMLKWASVIVIFIVIVIAAVPNFRYRVILPFHGEKSSIARLSLWNTGWKMVKDSPVLGKGLLGFSRNWDKFNTDKNLLSYPAPHNVLLNFWVWTGLLGAISFFGLCVGALWHLRKQSDRYVLGVALFIIALLVQGLVDIPYLKNDLALLFWLMYALL